MNVLATIAIRLAEEEAHPPETPNAWLPETFEIIYGGLAFFVVAFGLWKFAIPQLKKSLAARSDQIEKELTQSSNDRVSAENSAAYVRSNLGDIEAERARMLAEADEHAERVLAEGRMRVANEVRELESRASSDVQAGGSRLAVELQSQVASIAAAATEHVVRGSIDAATHDRLIEDVIAKIGVGA